MRGLSFQKKDKKNIDWMVCFKADTNVQVLNNLSALFLYLLKIYFIYICQTNYIFESLSCVKKNSKMFLYSVVKDYRYKGCPIILNYT